MTTFRKAALCAALMLGLPACVSVDGTRELRRRAEQGDAEAQTALGKRYDYGDGVRGDAAEAVRWYRKAAEQGLPAAQHLVESSWLHNGMTRRAARHLAPTMKIRVFTPFLTGTA